MNLQHTLQGLGACQRVKALAWLAPLLLALWLGCGSPLARAGEASATPAAGHRTYTTVPGDTLDRVVQKTMGTSPLKAELLRDALLQVNAQVLPAGRNPRLRPGTVLNLPDHEALLRSVVMPLLQPSDVAALAGPAADPRRRWVRYP